MKNHLKRKIPFYIVGNNNSNLAKKLFQSFDKSMLIVQKYGGATLADPEKIKNVAERLYQMHEKSVQVVAVVSAMGKTTNQLIQLAQQVSSHPNRREMDMLLSTGERVSMALVSMALLDLGAPAISFTGSQSGILTDDSHENAFIQDVKAFRVEEALAKNKIVVLAGFQGVSPTTKEITTLGRGGSDTTAVAMAAFLQADHCEILKDVPSVFSADPNCVTNVKALNELSYDEMLDMTFWGAKVLHYRSVELAKSCGVEMYVGPARQQNTAENTRNNNYAGTWIFARNNFHDESSLAKSSATIFSQDGEQAKKNINQKKSETNYARTEQQEKIPADKTNSTENSQIKAKEFQLNSTTKKTNDSQSNQDSNYKSNQSSNHNYEKSQVLAVNSHEQVLLFNLDADNTNTALEIFEKFLQQNEIPYPQVLHIKKIQTQHQEQIQMMITGPQEVLQQIEKSLHNNSDESLYLTNNNLCSVTTTCRGNISLNISKTIIALLEQNKIELQEMLLNPMSVTLILNSSQRLQAINLIHSLIQ